MTNFEDDLKSALRRREPGSGFAERVMARARTEPPRRRRLNWVWMAAAAAVLIAGIFIGNARIGNARREAQIAQGQQARQQTLLALRIVSQSLNTARSKVLAHTAPSDTPLDTSQTPEN